MQETPHDDSPAEKTPPVSGFSAATHASCESPESPRYRYVDLSQSGREVLIEYEGQLYRLRTTRNGKLILMK